MPITIILKIEKRKVFRKKKISKIKLKRFIILIMVYQVIDKLKKFYKDCITLILVRLLCINILNRELKLFSIVRPKKTNYKKEKPHKIFENLLKQDFYVAEPNKI